MHRCEQVGCEEKFDNLQEFIVHSSYHEYHNKIKNSGREELDKLENKLNIKIECPSSAAGLEGSYYFPQLPTQLVCEWYDCKMRFLSVEQFYEHVSHHAHRFVDRCYWDQCNKSFKKMTLQLLREHLRVHTLQKLYACPYCGNFFSTKIKFDDHFLRHMKLPDFVVDKKPSNITPVASKGGEPSFVIEEYEVGLRTVQVFRCTQENCDRAFLTSSLLREHIRSHSNKRQCDQCSYVANSSSRLESHKLYRHKNERSYVCTICQKTFKQRGDLRAHVRRHQIVEPYRCDKCDFETLNEEGLNTHSKIHDRMYEYCCHICQKNFSRGNNLSRHLRDLHKLTLSNGQARFKYKLTEKGVYILDDSTCMAPETATTPAETTMADSSEGTNSPESLFESGGQTS